MASGAQETITARAASNQQRMVFKHALDRPYTTTWPSVGSAAQDEIVSMLCAALQPLNAYFGESRRAAKYCRRRRRRHARGNKAEGAAERELAADRMKHTEETRAGAEMLKSVVLGINSTTRVLEKQVRRMQPSAADDLALVVVCRGDVEPHMVAHLPGLAHAARVATAASTTGGASSGSGNVLRLVGVGPGAEKRLAAAVGQQRVSAIGIRAGLPLLDEIVQKARATVATPAVPWIGGDPRARGLAIPRAVPEPTLRPMAVRELHTTAPLPNKKRGGDPEADSLAARKRKNTAADSTGKNTAADSAGK
ncbi:RNase P and RNase MRP subunit [Coemansia biformis]|uniref:RNase P and RNase MRP subunit n=1 Tax=Coemansia biformis TaxID=1286918 RepID=A0A9W7Y8L9_9FUNG|nr:RNase P and RNase MRP subunit [Coemansia biformis]